MADWVGIGLMRPDGTIYEDMQTIPSADNQEPGSQEVRATKRAELDARRPLGDVLVEFDGDPALQGDPVARPLALDGRGRLISHPTLRPARLRQEAQEEVASLRTKRAELLAAQATEGGDWSASIARVDAALAAARTRL